MKWLFLLLIAVPVFAKGNMYIDQYGRYHTKPVTESNPVPTNNGWIYTAYAKKVGLPVDNVALSQCSELCRVWKDSFMSINRSPGKESPPISRDEILGMISLKLIHTNLAETKNWNFSPYQIPEFSAVKLVKQLWELRPDLFTDERINGRVTYWSFIPKHRNYFWQNNLDQLYRFAFSVPLQDRYFILKTWDKFRWYKPSHLFYAIIAKIDSKLSPSGIRYLKYGGEENRKAMEQEFPEDHPVRNL